MKNYSDKTLDKKEQQIKKSYSPICFRESYEVNDIYDIFNYLFNERRSTYYLDGGLHCRAGKRRSYYDAYLLCMHYFPEISFKQMYRTLRELMPASVKQIKQGYTWQDPYFLLHTTIFATCPDIGRAVTCYKVAIPPKETKDERVKIQ